MGNAGGGAGGGAGGNIDHAGGPSSTLLNRALLTTHDGIVGYWKPGTTDEFSTPPSQPGGYEQLDYLTPTRRMALLGSTMQQFFQVIGNPTKPDTVSVSVGGKKVFTTDPPSRAFLKKQIVWLRNYADLRADREAEINVQLGDMLSFYGMTGRLDASQKTHSLELLTVVQSLMYTIEMQVKHYAWAPRPIDFSDRVMPMIQTPDHSTYPSGHSAEAFALATILYRLNPIKGVPDPVSGLERWSVPFRLAHRIAINRTIAGVHFPVDSAAGAILGIMVGEAIYGISQNKIKVRSSEFASEDAKRPPKPKQNIFYHNDDFTNNWLRDFKFANPVSTNLKLNPILNKCWQLAADEWK